jgi:prolyl-tRNA editing enzyme YbaK/EbsC (Cys-tRNA(Pro) deacylase)
VPIHVDQGVGELDRAIISAGRPDLGLALSPADLVRALGAAQVGDYCQEG